MATPVQADTTLTFRVERGGLVFEIEARSREPGKPVGLARAFSLQLRYLSDGLRLSAHSDAGVADLERFGIDLQRFGAPGTLQCDLRCVNGGIRLHRPVASASAVLDIECGDRSNPTQVRMQGVAVTPADILRLQAWCSDLTRRC